MKVLPITSTEALLRVDKDELAALLMAASDAQAAWADTDPSRDEAEEIVTQMRERYQRLKDDLGRGVDALDQLAAS